MKGLDGCVLLDGANANREEYRKGDMEIRAREAIGPGGRVVTRSEGVIGKRNIFAVLSYYVCEIYVELADCRVGAATGEDSRRWLSWRDPGT
jgi:hypothetical protein